MKLVQKQGHISSETLGRPKGLFPRRGLCTVLQTMSLLLLSNCRRRTPTTVKALVFSTREICRTHNSIRWQQSSFSFAALPSHCSDQDNECEPKNQGSAFSVDDNLQALQDKITKYNNGVSINVQSPKQVSMAVFGRSQSSAKSILQQAMTDETLPAQKRQLAHLILVCRSLMQKQQEEQQIRSFSTNDIGVERVEAAALTLEKESDDYENDSTDFVKESSLVQNDTNNSNQSPFMDIQKTKGHRPTHEQNVDSLFDRPTSKLDDYWREPLKYISRPVARDLMKQLDPTECPMGFDPNASPKKTARASNAGSAAGKKGSFLAFCREQKRMYPQCIILTRMGDFYETFGIDAIMLVEHVGLNPMGGKVKAGCPYRNVQATLNGLIEQGFSVAVYEEVGQTASNKLKTRVLSQIVSPASPTYLYDHNWLLGSSEHHQDNGAALDQLPPSRPCVGIVRTTAGYHMMEVSLEERSVEYSERLTPEAVSCRLAAYPPAEPLVYIPSPNESPSSSSSSASASLPFLPHPSRPSTKAERELVETHLGGFRLRTVILPPHLIPAAAASESERYIHAIVNTLLQWNEKRHEEGHELTSTSRRSGGRIPEQRPSVHDFTVSQSSAHTHPLYMETASQLGLLNDPAIPPLISHVLDDAAPAATRRFLKRYLLVPPPPEVAQAMARLVRSLLDDNGNNTVLPRLTVPPLGKILSLIRAGQASAAIYGELLHALAVTRFVVDGEQSLHALPVDALLTLCSHESGLVAEKESLEFRCQQAMEAIEAVICSSHHVEDEMLVQSGSSFPLSTEDSLSHYQYLPESFVERNELTWRGRVQRTVAEKMYERVEEAGRHLDHVIARDFIQGDQANQALIVQDIFNNLLVLKKVPNGGTAKDYIQPRDRHGKKLATRYTTEDVQQALSDYVTACDIACEEVSSILSNLAKTLQEEGHIPAIIQSAHLNLALSAAYHHAVKANKQNWYMADTIEPIIDYSNEIPPAAKFMGVWPYWMPQSQAVSNDFDLQGMFLLTAPNMSGKSTLMRSTAAAALLTVCGLCAPVSEGSQISRFDTLFLRGASADVPAENKSAFGAEMEDIAALMRCCGPKSLVFVDEIGRGTSPRDGARLAAAILEAMASRGMSGIFATHLHDVLKLPLQGKERIITKQMAISRSTTNENEPDDSYKWTYRLEDGICNDSLAMVTAARFGLPEEIIQRADDFDHYLPSTSVVSDAISNTETEDVKSDMESQLANAINGKVKDDSFDFQKAVALAEEMVGHSSTTIPSKASPPPALANQSCIYLLESNSNPPRYYVGETDAFFQRLQAHRSKGSAWSTCRAAVLPLSSKSDSRRFESRLIQRLVQAGFRLESIQDGRTYRM